MQEGKQMGEKYDAAYFIRKFSAIPDEKWCVWAFRIGDRCCARGWCGTVYYSQPTAEDVVLGSVLAVEKGSPQERCDTVGKINNGFDARYPQPTPRARILAALRDAKKAGR